MKRLLKSIFLFAVATSMTAQTTTFRHPGMMHSEADFERVKERLAAGESAATQSLANLRAAGPVYGDHGGNWAVNVDISRGITGAQNYMNAYRNCARAYQCALLWKITGERSYGDIAVDVLNAYATWNKSLSGNTNISLIPAFNGYQFLNAAEIMRDYDGWKKEDIEKFKQYMIDVWFKVAQDFLERRHDTVTRESNWFHYHSNWGVGNELFCISLGIFCDLPDIYNYGMYWLTEGPGNESLFVGTHIDEAADVMCGEGWGLMPWFHKDKRGPLGYFAQMQESGRDQGHAMASLGLMGNAFQTCYNQGDNLFNNMYNPLVPGLAGSTMGAAAAEYVAAYNNGIDNLPYTLNWWMGGFGPNGRGQWRPIWQLFINAYENRMGIEMPYSKQMHNAMGLEWGGGSYGNNSGGYDHTGWGDLMFNDAPVSCDMAPTPLYPTITGPTLLARGGVDPKIVTHHVGWVSGVTPGTSIEMSVSLPDGEEDTGLWEWEDGVKGKTRTVTANHSGLYRLHYTNSKGVKSTQLFSIAVRGEGIRASLHGNITYRGVTKETDTQLMGRNTTATLTTSNEAWNYVESETWYDENGKKIGNGYTYTYRQRDEKDHVITFVLVNQSGVEIRKDFYLKYDPSDLSHLLPDASCGQKAKWEITTDKVVCTADALAGTTGSYVQYAVDDTQGGISGWGLPTFSATQTATGLTPGRYTISANCLAAQLSGIGEGQRSQVDGIFLVANGIKVPVRTLADGTQIYTVECYVGSDSVFNVGICNLTDQNYGSSECGASKVAIDELQLRYLGKDGMTDAQIDQAAIQQKAANDAELMALVSEKFNADATTIAATMPDEQSLQTLATAVADAKTVDQLYAAHDNLLSNWKELLTLTDVADIDLTVLMHNASLSKPSADFYDNTSRWSTDCEGGNYRIFAIDGSDTKRGEAVSENMIERWCGGNFYAGQNILYQTLAGLPKGLYTFSAAAQRGADAGNILLFADGSTASLSSTTTVVGTANLRNYSAQARVTSSNGKLVFGLRAGQDNGTQWTSMTDMHLHYSSPVAIVKKALAEAELLDWGEDAGGKLAAAIEGAKKTLSAEKPSTTTLMTRYNTLITQIENYKKNNANAEHPYDLTASVVNPGFDLCNANGYEVSGKSAFSQGTVEFFNTPYELSQTVSGLSTGYYRVTMQARSGEGDANTSMQLFATASGSTSTAAVKGATRADGSDATQHLRQNADDFLDNPDADLVSVDIYVTSGSITFGSRCQSASNWCVIGGFTLQYMGKDASLMPTQWASLVEQAKTLVEDVLPGKIKDNLLAASDVDITGMSDADLEKAIKNLSSAIDAAVSVRSTYQSMLALRDDMSTLLSHSNELAEGAKDAFREAIRTAVETADAATTSNEVDKAAASLESARQTYVLSAIPHWGYEFDLTFCVANADISRTDGWMTDGTGNFQRMTNSEVDGEYVGPFWEKWDIQSYLFKPNDRPVYQTINNLHYGKYRLSAAAFRKNQFGDLLVSDGSMYLFLNDDKTEVTSEVMNYYEVVGETNDGTVTFGLKAGQGNTANWEALADVHLYYLGSPEVTPVTDVLVTDPARVDAVYDLQGRRLNAAPKRGLYIVNGRVVLR